MFGKVKILHVDVFKWRIKRQRTGGVRFFVFIFYSFQKPEHKSVPPIPGVNFTNVFCAAFTLVDPESVKEIQLSDLSHHNFFTLLGTVRIKAVRRTLMKLTPDNKLLADFAIVARY
jgi:hypothetical protein